MLRRLYLNETQETKTKILCPETQENIQAQPGCKITDVPGQADIRASEFHSKVGPALGWTSPDPEAKVLALATNHAE